MTIVIIILRMIEMRMIREIITMTRHRWRVNGPPIRSLGQKQRSHDLRQVIIINISIIIINILFIILINFSIIIINIPLILINIPLIIFNILLIIFIIIIILILIFNIPLIIILIILIILTITRGSGILQSDRGSGHIHSR